MESSTKISEHFDVRELVTPEMYAQFGESAKWFVSKEQIAMAEFIRVHFGKPVTINNWHTGGPFGQRGTRNPWTETGGKLSQHKFKSAIDFNVQGMTSDEVYNHIMSNQKLFMEAGVTTIESKAMTKGWTHIDCRITGLDRLLVVEP